MHTFSLKNLTIEQKKLRKRILEISHESHLSHLGSCFSAIDLIDEVYKIKKNNEKFILSNGHAGVALYAVLEKNGLIKDPSVTKKLHIHPDRNLDNDIHVSSGSLGQGLPIALGIALADQNKSVYCMISDGECEEGSIWEALRFSWKKKLNNLKIILIANGWGAYDQINLSYLKKNIKACGHKVKEINGHDRDQIVKALKGKTKNYPILIFAYTHVGQLPFLMDQDAHYYVMNDKDYKLGIKLLT